ncbi:hypothetical protein [Streptomyces mirabilis]|uniref:hypothetical protein n=1 Tax=Streptomyces mirabilis TaxID=68239 RepID=UPI0036BF4225
MRDVGSARLSVPPSPPPADPAPADHQQTQGRPRHPDNDAAASRVRGMMLGLALGDTLGAARGKLPADGPLRAGVSTQLMGPLPRLVTRH